MKLNLERNYEWKWRRERVFGFKDGMMCESNDGGCENRLGIRDHDGIPISVEGVYG